MKKLAVAAVIPTLALALVGCDETSTVTPQQIDSATRTQLNQDDAELKQALADAKAKDPSITDMYYSVNDKGEKELNVVREVKDPKTGESMASSSVWPLLGGMAAGMLVANMFNSSGGYNSAYRPSYSYTRSYDDERKRRGAATAGYAGYVRSNTMRTYSSSYNSNKSSFSSSPTRKSAAFSGSSSSRSSSYSSGG